MNSSKANGRIFSPGSTSGLALTKAIVETSANEANTRAEEEEMETDAKTFERTSRVHDDDDAGDRRFLFMLTAQQAECMRWLQ